MNTIEKLDNFTAEIQRVLKEAATKYHVGLLNHVSIRYNLRGRCAGQAVREHDGNLILRFNIEAIEKDYDGMFNDTIPHEVAHLVCFIRPELGKNHDKGWKKICEDLGGQSDRCHQIDLTPAKKTVRFLYVLEDGTEVRLTKKMHSKVRAYPGQLFMRPKHTNCGRRMDIYPTQFVKQVTV